MALRAVLILEDKAYDVLDLDYEISKPYHNNNKPSSVAEGGIINFTILTPLQKNYVFHKWVLSIEETKCGWFAFPLTHGTKHGFKNIWFDMAYCVRLQENYSSFNSSQMQMRLTIVASTIGFDMGDSSAPVYTNKKYPERPAPKPGKIPES